MNTFNNYFYFPNSSKILNFNPPNNLNRIRVKKKERRILLISFHPRFHINRIAFEIPSKSIHLG